MAATYNPSDVSIIYGGSPITGFADGTFVVVESNEDDFTLQVGSDGESARSKTNNNSGRITITLIQTSDSNDVLAAFHAADLLGGVGGLPILIKDNSGRALHSAVQAWIVKYPSSTFDREVTSKEWIFETDNLIQFPAGSD